MGFYYINALDGPSSLFSASHSLLPPLVYFIHWYYQKILYFWIAPSHSSFAHFKMSLECSLSTLNLFLKKPDSIREGWMVPSSVKFPLTSTPIFQHLAGPVFFSNTITGFFIQRSTLMSHDYFCTIFVILFVTSLVFRTREHSNFRWAEWRWLNSSSDNFCSISVGNIWVVINTYFIILQVPYLPIISCYKRTMKTETYMPRQVWIYFQRRREHERLMDKQRLHIQTEL